MIRTIAAISLTLTATAMAQEGRSTAPRIWDDKALEDWATPIAAIGVRPGHFTSAEYYAVPGENLRTYPVYRPDREPPGYWDWLQKQKPEPLVDASKLRTRDDWVKAGANAFQTLAGSRDEIRDQEQIRVVRDPRSYEGIWTKPDGSLLTLRWVVTSDGVKLAGATCVGCHARTHAADGTVIWGAAEAPIPAGFRDDRLVRRLTTSRDPVPFVFWQRFTVPWSPDERVEKLLDPREGDAITRSFAQSVIRGVSPRADSSPFYITKIPDLNNLHYSHYMDATATHRLRGPEDVARYAAFVTGIDPMEFGEYKILKPEQRKITSRFADEVLYAIGVYLMALTPPKNPETAASAIVSRGQEIFKRESCVNCHVPPDYTSGKLTLAQGYAPPDDHPFSADIVNRSVGTDPGLALKTRKGTGFYKVPSLRGLWYRNLLLHDGSMASLEEMFDPARLRPDHEPGGWKGPGVTKRAIPGHPFGLNLNTEDKGALLAFLRSL